MATDQSHELIEHILSHPPRGEFKPCAYYGPDEDALMFYFRDEPDYAKRLNSRVTVYLSIDTDEVVGCQIKGVGRVLDELGTFDVTVQHGKVKLMCVLMALVDSFAEQPENVRDVFRKASRRAVQDDVDLEVMSPA